MSSSSSSPGKPLTLRFRGRDGTFRQSFEPETCSIVDVFTYLEGELRSSLDATRVDSLRLIYRDGVEPEGRRVGRRDLHPEWTLGQTFVGLAHGELIRYDYEQLPTSPEPGVSQTSTSTIVTPPDEIEEEEGESDSTGSHPHPRRRRGRRRRRRPISDSFFDDIPVSRSAGGARIVDFASHLRDRENLIIKIKKQPRSGITRVEMDRNAGLVFERGCRVLCGERMDRGRRMGYLFGKFVSQGSEPPVGSGVAGAGVDESTRHYMQTELPWVTEYGKVEVHAIYEPKQTMKNGRVVELRGDAYKKRAIKIAKLIGLSLVGWIFCKSAEEEFLESGDVIRMAKMQGMFGDSFVTVVMRPHKFNPQVAESQAFQVSGQFCDLVKAGLAQSVSKQSRPDVVDLVCPVQIVNELRDQIEVETWIKITLPIGECKSFLYMGFPPRNRTEGNSDQSFRELRRVFTDRRGLRFSQIIADFHLLLFLTDLFNLEQDYPVLCQAVVNGRDVMADRKYEPIVRHHINKVIE